MVFGVEVFLLGQLVNLAASLENMGVKEWAAVLTIGWILYQFIDKRRLTEANIDAFFERHFTEKLKSIEDQRRTYLIEIASSQNRLPLHSTLIMCIAYIRRFLWFAWCIARLNFTHTSAAAHAMLLLDCKQLNKAKKEFLSAASDLQDTASLYKKQASAKRREAVNALIFAGRVAALQGDNETTIDAFNRALKIRISDLDARKFIGEQFWAVGNFTAALQQFDDIATSTAAKRDKGRAAEAPLQGDVLLARKDITEARKAFEASLTIEEERKNFEGMAETQERLGDTFVSDNRTLEDAKDWYTRSLENYLTTSNKKAIARLRSKLRGVRLVDTWASKRAEELGRYLTEKVAMRLRAPVKKP
jgi:tetratricopeptide (TPR) repeat protein